ncbi:hypothetical protein CASFOL_039981 [Castilleja foliolosa]|uniref:Uncharacterized protein n=1 Tax=Castilleja foliolosa TaxID=1961234 RepID=A0ABD3BHK8_9LAMI
MAFRLIKDVDRTNKPNLKLRVVRCITKAGFANKDSGSTLEVIFHDKEGGRITGVVKQINMRLYQNRFIEGRVYGVRSYYIENNTGRFRTTLAQFKLVFHAKTLLIEFPEEHFFPNYMFDFRDYATLVDVNKVDETLLFDVIGKVNEIHNPQERGFSGKRVRLIEIVLEDLSGRKINCTLWDTFVDQILAFESNLTAEIPVLILQMCRAKIYRDKVTLLKIDDVDSAKSLTKSSLTVARVELDDLSSGKTKFYPVDNLYSVDEESTFWICATISSFIGEWWYLACTRCHRKLREAEDEFYCDGCRKSYKGGIYRYKVQLEVLDSTANASLLCWDREAERLIGRPCHDLRVDMLEKQEPFIDIPEDLAKLIDQTVLFKVNVKHYQINNESSVFTVVKLYTDPDLVKNYNKWTLERGDEADFLSLMMKEDYFDEAASEDEVTTPIKKVDNSKTEVGGATMKKLMFEEECVGSNNGNILSATEKSKKRKRKMVISDESEDEEGLKDATKKSKKRKSISDEIEDEEGLKDEEGLPCDLSKEESVGE